MKGTEDEIELFFESGLNNLLSLSQRCEAAATACEQGFQDLSNLTRKFWPRLTPFPHCLTSRVLKRSCLWAAHTRAEALSRQSKRLVSLSYYYHCLSVLTWFRILHTFEFFKRRESVRRSRWKKSKKHASCPRNHSTKLKSYLNSRLTLCLVHGPSSE